jgi:hypothetical protein
MNVYRIELIGRDGIPHVRVLSSSERIDVVLQDAGGDMPILNAPQSTVRAALSSDGQTTVIVTFLGFN